MVTGNSNCVVIVSQPNEKFWSNFIFGKIIEYGCPSIQNITPHILMITVFVHNENLALSYSLMTRRYCMYVLFSCRVSHTKKSTSPNPNQNLRTFNMFEGVKQPSYSRTKSRSLSPMPSSHSDSPSSSSYSPVLNTSLSPQSHTSVKRKGKNIFYLFICLFVFVVPVLDSPSLDAAALSKRSRTQVYSGKRTGSQGKLIVHWAWENQTHWHKKSQSSIFVCSADSVLDQYRKWAIIVGY